MTGLMLVRVSWVMYIRPLLQIVLLSAATWAYIAFWPAINGHIEQFLGERQAVLGLLAGLIPVALFATGVVKAIWRIALNRSVVLTINQQGVAYRSGILPWKRLENYWRYDQIYRAVYSNRPPFLGWLFRCGDLVIVGREGSTREYRFRGLHHPRRAQLVISGRTSG